MGGGVLGLGNPHGRGSSGPGNLGRGGKGSKKHAIRRGVWIFSGITHYETKGIKN